MKDRSYSLHVVASSKLIRVIHETVHSHSINDSYDGVSSEGIAFRDSGTDKVIGVAISYPTIMGTPELREDL